MELNIDDIATCTNTLPISKDNLNKMKCFLKRRTNESVASFTLHSFQSLMIIEQWAWHTLCEESDRWINQKDYEEMLYELAAFNNEIIFIDDTIQVDIKTSLLVSATIDQIKSILEKIESCRDDNSSFITIASLWFDNLSYLFQQYPQLNHLSIINHINQYFGYHFIMSPLFRTYLSELHETDARTSMITSKKLFYMKTCSFSLTIYFYTKPLTFPYTPKQILQQLSDDYLRMIRIHSATVQFWNTSLLSCVTHITRFIYACYWWEKDDLNLHKILFPNEQILKDYIQVLVLILSYDIFHKNIKNHRSNDETMLIDIILVFLLNLIQTQFINNSMFRSIKQISNVLLKILDSSVPYQFSFYIYSILSEISLTKDLEDFQLIDTMLESFFYMLEQAWKTTSKIFQQIQISSLFRSLICFTRNQLVQERIVQSNKIEFLIDISEEYRITYEILWNLSFHEEIKRKLNSNKTFVLQLTNLIEECDNSQILKAVHGILWNIAPWSNSNDENEQIFDIMISYSQQDNVLCKKIYDELTKNGYRVLSNFENIQKGNIIDQMIYNIQKSNIIIICMSEQYQQDNYCHTEAHYALQEQRKIVPIIVQKDYEFDGWLLTFLNQLFYIDFNKQEFTQAIDILFKRINDLNISAITTTRLISSSEDKHIDPLTLTWSTQNIITWDQENVKEWLIKHDLIQLSRLFQHFDGRSLIYCNKYLKYGQPQQVLSLLQEEALKRTNEHLSLIELARFHSLMDTRQRLTKKNYSLSFIDTTSNDQQNTS